MRRVLFLAILLLPLFGVSKYKDGIWWEKPVFTASPVDVGPFMVYKTPLKVDNFFLTRGGILVYGNWQLTLFSPAFEKRGAMGGLDQVVHSVCKSACEVNLILPSRDGKRAVLGLEDQDVGVYHLIMVDLIPGTWKKIGEFKGEKYPGYAPNERFKKMYRKDKGMLKDYLWIVFHGNAFSPSSSWVGDKLYLWFPPDYGTSFGGLYIFDLKTGKSEFPFKNLDLIIGVNEKFLVYSLLKDPDATEVAPEIWVKAGKEKFVIREADPHHALLSSHWLLYRKMDHLTWVLYDLRERRAVGHFKMKDGDHRVLYLTPSGNRVFLEAKINGKKSLYLYDFRQGRFYELFPEGGSGFRVQACYDGEFFIFSHRGYLWVGYLTDLTAPGVKVKTSPLYKGKAFKSPVNLKVEVADRCFVSGVAGEIVLNGKKYPLKENSSSLRMDLREGENPVEISARDRAGNTAHLQKKIIYQKPPRVSLMEIGKNPARYLGKLVLIEGWAWGWAAKGPEEARKLPLAPGNTGKSRNWGSITDGTAVALFPISPSSSRSRVRVYAVIRPQGKGWLIDPILTEHVSQK